MRLNLKFQLDKNEINTEYRRAFMSYIKGALTELEKGIFFDKLYGDSIDRRNFTFAVKLSNPKFTKNSDTIQLETNQVEMNISTNDSMTLIIMNNAFINMLNRNVKFSNSSITLKKINTIGNKTIPEGDLFIKMMSPLCIRDRDKEENSEYYYSVSNDKFKEKFTEIVSSQLIKEGFSEDKAKVSIVPVQARKTVVTHYGQKIECSIGNFILRGDRKVLQYLYDCGVGSRKSAGFGMFTFDMNI